MKLCRCPACGRVGWLNAHGNLRGYALDGAHGTLRGARFFCSNRGRRGGCGATFSVVIASTLRGFVVPTTTLWSLLSAMLVGTSCAAAWRACCGSLSLRSGYRLWCRLHDAQSSLRSALCRRGPPPACDERSPWAQLVAHLRAVVGDVADPLAAFQIEFQRGLFDGSRPR